MTPEQENFIKTYRKLNNMDLTKAATGMSAERLHRLRWRDHEFHITLRKAINEAKEKRLAPAKKLAKATIEITKLRNKVAELNKLLKAEKQQIENLSRMLLRARNGLL